MREHGYAAAFVTAAEQHFSQHKAFVEKVATMQVSMKAHSLKGGAATLGLPLVSACAGALEHQIELGATPDLEALVGALDAVCPALCAVADMAESA